MSAHIWWARRGIGGPFLLQPSEQLRWGRLQNPADRERFAVGAALARYAIRLMTADRRADITRLCSICGANDHGPVSPAGSYADAWSLSISHSGDVIGVGIAPVSNPIGIDVEAYRERWDSTRTLVCQDLELRADMRHGDLNDALLARWVRKEAVLKAARVGLAVPMTHLRISDVDAPMRLLSWSEVSRPPGLDVSDVVCHDVPSELFAPAGNYRGAIAFLFGGPEHVEHRWVGPELTALGAYVGPGAVVAAT